MARRKPSPAPAATRDKELQARLLKLAPRKVVEIDLESGGAHNGLAAWRPKPAEYVGFGLQGRAHTAPSLPSGLRGALHVPFRMTTWVPGKAGGGRKRRRFCEGNGDALAKFISAGHRGYDLILIRVGQERAHTLAAWSHARQLLARNGACLFTRYGLEGADAGCKEIIDGLDRSQWQVEYFGGIAEESGGRFTTMVEVRRRGNGRAGHKMRRARVRFIGHMPAVGYSGGRLLAITYAEALATTGTDVEFLVDNNPEMYEGFRSFSRVTVRQVDFNRLSRFVDPSVDIVVIVPEADNIARHGEYLRHAVECRARIVLLNFETPNWFNEISPHKRPLRLWEGWNIVGRSADLVLSISAESDKWARKHYTFAKEGCRFDYCYTAINTVVADSVPAVRERAKRILILTRAAAHKGTDAMIWFAHPEFADYGVTVVVGNGQLSDARMHLWRQRFARAGVHLELLGQITDAQKFALLKSSSLLFFPTQFEGFGIPPLEAAYCMLPTVCSDLPVLREFGGDAFIYVDPSKEVAVRKAAWKAMANQEALLAAHPRLASIARVDDCGRRLAAILEKLL